MATPTAAQAGPVHTTQEDEKLVQVFEQYDEYLADQQHAIELLKQGFLKLTMAKINLTPHTLGELSYKDDFEAALYAADESDGTITIVKADDRVSSPPDSPVEPSSSGLKRRKDQQANQPVDSPGALVGAPASAHSGASHEDAAIMWFSSLPPTNLRLAQKNFRSALRALLASAASARKIQAGVMELTRPADQS